MRGDEYLIMRRSFRVVRGIAVCSLGGASSCLGGTATIKDRVFAILALQAALASSRSAGCGGPPGQDVDQEAANELAGGHAHGISQPARQRGPVLGVLREPRFGRSYN